MYVRANVLIVLFDHTLHFPPGVSGDQPHLPSLPSSFIPDDIHDDVHVGPNRVSRVVGGSCLFSLLPSIPQLRRQVNGFYIVEWALFNDFAQVSGGMCACVCVCWS